jgi:predicted regulator of Ras-like GTPase activity (Roadblock/LC7/MglB family)
MSQASNEAPRDQVESAFTPILRRVRESVPSVLAAVFVDTQGECIDYASALAPYDAKVNAAHMLIMMDLLRAGRDKAGVGEPLVLEIMADERDLWVHRMGDEYVLIVVLTPGFDRAQLKSALLVASADFRREVGLEAPAWEGSGKRLSVRVRPSPGWQYAPEAYSTEGVRVVIADVLGRWTEAGGVAGDDLVCFRVRTAEGQELTLLHDPDIDGWTVRE